MVMVRRWFALLAIGGALACAAAACADEGDLQPQPLPPGNHGDSKGETSGANDPSRGDDSSDPGDGKESPTSDGASDAGADADDGGADQ